MSVQAPGQALLCSGTVLRQTRQPTTKTTGLCWQTKEFSVAGGWPALRHDQQVPTRDSWTLTGLGYWALACPVSVLILQGEVRNPGAVLGGALAVAPGPSCARTPGGMTETMQGRPDRAPGPRYSAWTTAEDPLYILICM